jgi:hypothetical protein
MDLLACADEAEIHAKALAVQAAKARKLRDRLFISRMEEIAAELCTQYVHSAETAVAQQQQQQSNRNYFGARPPHQSPLRVPSPQGLQPELLRAKIVRLQEEIFAAVADEAKKSNERLSLSPRRPPPQARSTQQQQQQQSTNARVPIFAAQPPPPLPGGSSSVLSSRGLRGVHQPAPAGGDAPDVSSSIVTNVASISNRLRRDVGGAGLAHLPSSLTASHVSPSTTVLQDRNNLLSSVCQPMTSDDLPGPLSVATLHGRYREKSLFPSLDVLLDGNTKVISARTPRRKNAVELGMQATPAWSLSPLCVLLASSTSASSSSASLLVDPSAAAARNVIQSKIPELGYVADLEERQRRQEEAERNACARRAESGWSPRDVLMGEAQVKKRGQRR